jgi:Flp pilus assembly protein TadD
MALDREGRWEEALERALAAKPGLAEAENNLGIVLAGEGRMAEAEAHFGRAVRLRPEFEEARRNLDLLREKRSEHLSPGPAPVTK